METGEQEIKILKIQHAWQFALHFLSNMQNLGPHQQVRMTLTSRRKNVFENTKEQNKYRINYNPLHPKAVKSVQLSQTIYGEPFPSIDIKIVFKNTTFLTLSGETNKCSVDQKFQTGTMPYFHKDE